MKIVIWEGIGVSRGKFLMKNTVFDKKKLSILAQDGRRGNQDGAKLAPRAAQMEPEWTASLDFCRLDWTSLYRTQKTPKKVI